MSEEVPRPLSVSSTKSKTKRKKEVIRNLTHKFTIGKLNSVISVEESKLGVTSIQFDPGNKYLAAGLWDSSIEIYNLFTGELSFVLNRADEKAEVPVSTFLEVKYPVTSMKWRPQKGLSKTQNILVNGWSDGSIKYWHTTSGKLIHSKIEEGNGIYSIDYNSDGTRLVTGGSDTFIRYYDDEAKDIVQVFKDSSEEYLSHFNRIFWVKFDPYDDRIIYSGGWDRMININDVRQKTPVSHIVGPFLSADTLDVYSTNLLVGNYDTKNPLEIYDLRKLERINTIEWITEEGGKGGLVLGAIFSKPKADAIIACGSSSNEFKIFDTNSHETIASVTGIKKPIYSVDVSTSNNLIAFGTSDGRINVLEYNNL